MLERIKREYKQWIQQLYKTLLRKNSEGTQSGICCITINSQDFSLLYARQIDSKPELLFFGTYPYKDNENLKYALSSLVKQYHLQRMPCAWVLSPENYQLLPTDALPVKPEEFQAAIRWKIKDLLLFSIDDTVVSQFPLPASKMSAASKIVVVAAQKSYLEGISDIIKASGLVLNVIDIPELAVCNTLQIPSDNTDSHALVYFQDSNIRIQIIYQNQLYFTRSLGFGLELNQTDTTAFAQDIEKLATEIQRSFDYYQAQWRLPLPLCIKVVSTKIMAADVLEQISQRVGMPMQLLDVCNKLVSKQILSFEQQGQYLPMLGELLRSEHVNNAAN